MGWLNLAEELAEEFSAYQSVDWTEFGDKLKRLRTIWNRRWRDRHPERIYQYNLNYKLRHPEKVRAQRVKDNARRRERRAQNRAREAAIRKKYWDSLTPEKKAQQLARKRANYLKRMSDPKVKARKAETDKAWLARNPEKREAIWKRHNERKKAKRKELRDAERLKTSSNPGQ